MSHVANDEPAKPEIEEYVKPLVEDPLDKLADAIRKSWIRERSMAYPALAEQ